MEVFVRQATESDLPAILHIFNQGVADRIATLEQDEKDLAWMTAWFDEHQGRYPVLVAETKGHVAGWASLNRYSHRCAYDGVADLSVYVEREHRGKGIGRALLRAVEEAARIHGFHKIVLFALPFNQAGQRLYGSCGFREVGVFSRQGKLDGRYVDVMAMEKLLDES